MNFDFNRTLTIIKGGVIDSESTWREYLGEEPTWQKTAVLIAGPLIVLSVLCSVVLSRAFGGFSQFSYGGNILVALVLGTAMAALGFVVAAGIFSFFGGKFGGQANFDRAFAAVALAAIPGYIAGALGSLVPWLGAIVALAGGIVSLVFMYQIMPLALGLPDDRRVGHFLLSLLCIFVINMILAAVLSIGTVGRSVYDVSSTGSQGHTPPGILGEMQRQGALLETAESDRFEPPKDGEISDAQIARFVDVMEKTQAVQAEYLAKMDKISQQMENKESPSLSDLGKIYSGASEAMGAHNAELEVVKTGGGNWAEHQWVKQQLRAAKIHKTGSEAVEHNYELYQQHAQLLDSL